MKLIRILASMVAAALLLAGCATQPSSNPSTSASTDAGEATIGLTYIPNVQFAPFYVGVDDGHFANAGVTVKLRHHGAQEGLFTALAAGEENFVIAGGDEMMQARAQGMDLVAVGQYYRHYPVVLIVPENSPIKNPQDLKGHSVGVPGRFGESWFGLQVLLKHAGLTEKDVTIKEIGYTTQAALTTNKVDAVIGFSNNDQVQFERAGFKTRMVKLTDKPMPLASISLITTRAYAQAHPDQVKAVVAGMVKATQSVVDDQNNALTVSEKHVPNLKADRDNAAATLKATAALWADETGKVSARMDAEQWAQMAIFMKENGLITTAVDPKQAMTNDYVNS